MKKFLFLLLLTITFSAAIQAQSWVPVTAYQRNGVTIADSVQTVNVDNIGKIYTSGTKTYFTYIDYQLKTTQTFTTRQTADTIAQAGNKTQANFIKLNEATDVNSRDSFSASWFNLDNCRVVDGATSGKIYSQAKLYYKDYNGTRIIPIVETSARYYTMQDSIKLYASLPYKIWCGTLSQSSTAAPIVQSTGIGGANTPFQNNIGTITWARTGSGTYTGTLTGAFTSGKVYFNIASITQQDASTVTVVRTSADVITITTSADSKLSNFPLEIRVYK